MRVDGHFLVDLFAAKEIQGWEELLFNFAYSETGPESPFHNSNTKPTEFNRMAMIVSRRRHNDKRGEKNLTLETSADDNSDYGCDK